MKIITQTCADLNSNLKIVTRFLKKYQVSLLLKTCNAYKTKGFSVISVFECLLSVIFTNRSMYMNYVTSHHCPEFGKDTIDRFMNSPKIHWQKFTTLLAARVTNQSLTRLTNESRENVLIVDDTLFERDRSKNVELLSRVFDHVKHRYTKGFRLLTLGWSDGNTFIPVSGSLLSSSDDKNLLIKADDRLDKRSIAARRRSQSGRKATEVMLELIGSALKSGISPSYVLFDTWFCSPSALIAMAKKMPKIHYLFDGEKKSVKAIYSACKKTPGAITIPAFSRRRDSKRR